MFGVGGNLPKTQGAKIVWWIVFFAFFLFFFYVLAKNFLFKVQ